MLKNSYQIVNLLKNKKLTLAITDISGASKIFKFGIITYSNQSKIRYLKVSSKIIKKYGAVSSQCCKSMVSNLSKISRAKLNIAITGIAGPLGGSKSKPIGLVYIGIKKRNKIQINKYLFKNQNRKKIRINAVNKSLELIKNFI